MESRCQTPCVGNWRLRSHSREHLFHAACIPSARDLHMFAGPSHVGRCPTLNDLVGPGETQTTVTGSSKRILMALSARR
jgi:hypothetical protein